MLLRSFPFVFALLLVSCSGSSAPQPEAPAPADPAPSDAAPPADAPAAAESGDEQPDYVVEEITKIPTCDEYLALYRFCEPRLKEEIMAGDRRTYAAERGSLEYFLTTPEREGMAEACADMLHALEQDCLTR